MRAEQTPTLSFDFFVDIRGRRHVARVVYWEDESWYEIPGTNAWIRVSGIEVPEFDAPGDDWSTSGVEAIHAHDTTRDGWIDSWLRWTTVRRGDRMGYAYPVVAWLLFEHSVHFPSKFPFTGKSRGFSNRSDFVTGAMVGRSHASRVYEIMREIHSSVGLLEGDMPPYIEGDIKVAWARLQQVRNMVDHWTLAQESAKLLLSLVLGSLEDRRSNVAIALLTIVVKLASTFELPMVRDAVHTLLYAAVPGLDGGSRGDLELAMTTFLTLA